MVHVTTLNIWNIKHMFSSFFLICQMQTTKNTNISNKIDVCCSSLTIEKQ